jgi:hypothetical protein
MYSDQRIDDMREDIRKAIEDIVWRYTDRGAEIENIDAVMRGVCNYGRATYYEGLAEGSEIALDCKKKAEQQVAQKLMDYEREIANLKTALHEIVKAQKEMGERDEDD